MVSNPGWRTGRHGDRKKQDLPSLTLMVAKFPSVRITGEATYMPAHVYWTLENSSTFYTSIYLLCVWLCV